MLAKSCDLVGYVDDGPDKLQHLAWLVLDPHFYPQDDSAWHRRIREMCVEYFRQLDALLGDAVEAAGESGRSFIASDRNCGTTRIFFINTWLEQNESPGAKMHKGTLRTTFPPNE